MINKVTVRITKEEYAAFYTAIHENFIEVYSELKNRNGDFELTDLILFDMSNEHLNSTRLAVWQSRLPNKLYAYNLKLGQSSALCIAYFGLDFMTNPALYSFINKVYTQLVYYVHPATMDRLGREGLLNI